MVAVVPGEERVLCLLPAPITIDDKLRRPLKVFGRAVTVGEAERLRHHDRPFSAWTDVLCPWATERPWPTTWPSGGPLDLDLVEEEPGPLQAENAGLCLTHVEDNGTLVANTPMAFPVWARSAAPLGCRGRSLNGVQA